MERNFNKIWKIFSNSGHSSWQKKTLKRVEQKMTMLQAASDRCGQILFAARHGCFCLFCLLKNPKNSQNIFAYMQKQTLGVFALLNTQRGQLRGVHMISRQSPTALVRLHLVFKSHMKSWTKKLMWISGQIQVGLVHPHHCASFNYFLCI